MKVHTSNYAMSGFTASVAVAELADWRARTASRSRSISAAAALVDLAQWQLPQEPTLRETIAAGA